MGNINDYGFPFTSSNGDRTYTAADFRAFYALLFATGVAFGALDALGVAQQATPDMSVLVGTGAAMIEGAMRVIETAETLEPNPNPAAEDRIDYVVVRLVYATRRIDLALVQGVAGAGAPALTRNASIYELAIASLTLPSGYAAVTTAMITDTREDAALCGYLGFQTLRASALVVNSVSANLVQTDQVQATEVLADVADITDITAATLDMGQGANVLYPMDQDVRKAASPIFAGLTLGGVSMRRVAVQYSFSGNNNVQPMNIGDITTVLISPFDYEPVQAYSFGIMLPSDGVYYCMGSFKIGLVVHGPNMLSANEFHMIPGGNHLATVDMSGDNIWDGHFIVVRVQ